MRTLSFNGNSIAILCLMATTTLYITDLFMNFIQTLYCGVKNMSIATGSNQS